MRVVWANACWHPPTTVATMIRNNTMHRFSAVISLIVCAACSDAAPPIVDNPDDDTETPPSVATAIATQSATVGIPVSIDATLGGHAFTDAKQGGLTYTVTFPAGANGMHASGGLITGTATAPAVTQVRITARDVRGDSASQTFDVVAFAAGLTTPTLPLALFPYSDASIPLAPWYAQGAPGAPPVLGADNTPVNNRTTDAGATLGRVLFYDRRLSANDRVSCGSCHMQQFGFADTVAFSRGFNGELTTRHTMAIGNARFYQRGRFFWDERAATLEDQVLQPIQNSIEMGMTLDNVVKKVSVTSYYPALFAAAFGTTEINSDRIARALAQYVRSLVTSGSSYDSGFTRTPPFSNLSALAQQGLQIFNGPGGCAACHGTNANISDNVHNNGIDAVVTDVGAGGGRFKAPSLRNVAVRAPYMHDGRFISLDEVVGFYDSGVEDNPNLDPRLRSPGGGVKRLNLGPDGRHALVMFLNTLTDSTFLTAPRFSDPFVH